ncbi:winged helix-turn-helix domain-containing protein [Glycomyces tenuis]|uniref:winged helix-turn-helix domain-containing protein n=1 Tax=Glycomyces tenuis TaxID=58116 RepID=UPI0003FF6D4A|nr:helix-turn-helix domain-containing protein [Glycomyces tenuis]
MENADVKRVTDAATLKAVAHPLRGKLLGSLRVDGPATASELARRFDESSGATSYHLRVLAAFGFIEEDPEQPNARDRRWRAMHRFTSWNDRDFDHDPAGAEAARFLRRAQHGSVVEASERWESQMDKWSDEWAAAFGHRDLHYRLTAASLRELKDRAAALIDEYAGRDDDAEGAQDVVVFLSAFPRPQGES